MIIALIAWLCKRILPALRNRNRKYTQLSGNAATRTRLQALVITLLVCMIAKTQETGKLYSVIYKGEDVGTVRLIETNRGDTVHYKIISDINARFVVKICVKSVEESTFKNNKLIYSTVNRTVNGNQKVNRSTRAGNKIYNFSKEGKAGVINNESISYNVMKLYTTEPVSIFKVYSDNHQQFLPIRKTGLHTYKLFLPDGNYNLYTYANGICTKVEVFSTMYDMKMILKS